MKGGMTFPKLGFIPGYQPTVIVIALILFLTLLPRPLGEEDFQLFEGADKVVHFIMFGGLTGTFMYDRWRAGHPLSLSGALLTATASALFGVDVEILQSLMHLGRTGNDLADILANTLGAFTAILVGYIFIQGRHPDR